MFIIQIRFVMQSAQLVVAKREFFAGDSQIISRSSKENQQSIVLPQQQAEDEQEALLAQWISNISDKVEYLEERDIQNTIMYKEAEKIITSLYNDLDKVNTSLDKTQRSLQVLGRDYDESILKITQQGEEVLQLQQQQVAREETVRQLSIKVMQFEGRSVCQIIENQLPVLRALFNDSPSITTDDRDKLRNYIQDLEKKNVDITKLLNRSELSLEQHSDLKLWVQQTHILLDAINAAIATWEVLITKNIHTETQAVLDQIQAQENILKEVKRLVLEESPKQNHELILSIDDLKDMDDHLKDLQNWKDKLEGIISNQRIPLSNLEKTQRVLGKSIDYLPRVSRAVKRLSAQVSTDIKSVAVEFMALSEQKITELKASKTTLEQRAERINNPLTFPQNKKNEVTVFLQHFAEKVQEITALKDLSVMNIEQMFALRGMLFELKARLDLVEEKKQELEALILSDFKAEANQLAHQVYSASEKTPSYLSILGDVVCYSTTEVKNNFEVIKHNININDLQSPRIESLFFINNLEQIKDKIQNYKHFLAANELNQAAMTSLAISTFQNFFRSKVEFYGSERVHHIIQNSSFITEIIGKFQQAQNELRPLLDVEFDLTTLNGLSDARAELLRLYSFITGTR